MKKAGMPLFSLDKVVPCFAGMEVEGKDMRVPIGHGDGLSPFLWVEGRADERSYGSTWENPLYQYESISRSRKTCHGGIWRVYRCRNRCSL
jgi:hypothetical protein